MAFKDDQLGDAGRDYYGRQFDGRIRNIRKPGAAPSPSGSRSYGTRGAIGGGIFALFILIRIFIGCAGAGSSSYDSSSSSSYDFTPPPAVESPPPPPILNNNDPDDPPWKRDLENPPVGPDNPGVEAPNARPGKPDADPGDGRDFPDKDR